MILHIITPTFEVVVKVTDLEFPNYFFTLHFTSMNSTDTWTNVKIQVQFCAAEADTQWL